MVALACLVKIFLFGGWYCENSYTSFSLNTVISYGVIK